MLRTGVPYILDCSGPEDWHEHLEPEEIARRRVAFKLAFEGAALQFRTILNVAGMTNGKPGTMTLGRRLETWARGVEMPERMEVREADRGRYRILMPCEAEVSASVGSWRIRGLLPPNCCRESGTASASGRWPPGTR